jgi:hypothetical protein
MGYMHVMPSSVFHLLEEGQVPARGPCHWFPRLYRYLPLLARLRGEQVKVSEKVRWDVKRRRIGCLNSGGQWDSRIQTSNCAVTNAFLLACVPNQSLH